MSGKPDVILSDRDFRAAQTKNNLESCREESFTRGKSCLMNNAAVYDQQNCRNSYSTCLHMFLTLAVDVQVRSLSVM